jgi:hypothetical protein
MSCMWLPWLCAGCARVFYLQRQGSAFCPWAVGGERGDHSGGVDRGGMPPAAHSLRGSNKFGKARHRWSNSSAICMHSVSHRPRRTCSWSPPPPRQNSSPIRWLKNPVGRRTTLPWICRYLSEPGSQFLVAQRNSKKCVRPWPCTCKRNKR